MKKKLYLVLAICCLSIFAMMGCDNDGNETEDSAITEPKKDTGTDTNNNKDDNIIDDAGDAIDDAGDAIDNNIDDPTDVKGDIIDDKNNDSINDATD